MTKGKRRFIRLLAAGMRWVDGRWFMPAECLFSWQRTLPYGLGCAKLEPAIHLDGYWVRP
jgi:hypothetical protein